MRRIALAMLAVLVLAGCSATLPPGTTTSKAPVRPGPASLLSGAVEPAGFAAPTFHLVGAVAKGGPVYGDGEPSIAATANGTLFISFPGCDTAFYLVQVPSQPTCDAGIVYRSLDHGASWQRLNHDADGRLASDSPPANGDADIAVDWAGTVYVSNLGDGIETQSSSDGGRTWTATGNVVPKDSRSVDRNWLAAAAPGHVIHNWMGGKGNAARQVGVTTTWDGGATYSNVTYLGDQIGWEGSVQFAPDGVTAYIPFTQPGPAGTVGSSWQLWVAKTVDGGRTWDVLDTGLTTKTAAASFHFSGLVLAPALAVSGDGTVVYAWSEEVPDPTGATNTGAVVRFSASTDGGATWTKPTTVSSAPSAIFPWIVGGAGDRFALTYFADTLPGDPDRSGRWDLHAVAIDGAAEATPRILDTLVQADIHVGGICGGGGSCLLTGGDRALLDYFECTLQPDGKLAIVYPADPVDGGKYIEIRVALQEGGSAFFVPLP